MPLLEILQVVIGEARFTIRSLPDQELQGLLDGAARRRPQAIFPKHIRDIRIAER